MIVQITLRDAAEPMCHECESASFHHGWLEVVKAGNASIWFPAERLEQVATIIPPGASPQSGQH